jgi:hypothetical protein
MDRLAQRNKARKLEKWLKARKFIGDKIKQKEQADAKRNFLKKGEFAKAVQCLKRAAKNDLIFNFKSGIPLMVNNCMGAREPANDNYSAFKGCYEFANKLMKRGFKHIGSGAYSRVVAKDGSDKCIKVCRHAQSDGWVDYVLWANKNGYGGTFAPKIYSYKWIKCKGSEGGFGVAVMERMKQTVSRAKRTEDAKFLPILFEYGVYANDNAKLLADLVQPGIGNFIDDFRKEFGEDANFDLHTGNFMVREDGSFCVSDPLAGSSSSSYSTRYRRAA